MPLTLPPVSYIVFVITLEGLLEKPGADKILLQTFGDTEKVPSALNLLREKLPATASML